jgi:hypothetical protein
MLVLYTTVLPKTVVMSSRASEPLVVAAKTHRSARDPAAAIFATLFTNRHPRDDVAVLTMRAQGARLERVAIAHDARDYATVSASWLAPTEV